MQVSVVIPVYNAARYVRHAVESALAQPETREVLVIEDGSPDGSLQVCQELAATHSLVRLLRHPMGENRGAGASRNLGIQRSIAPYIAFLDADDFFLPNRLAEPLALLESDESVDGVYEAVGTHVERSDGICSGERSQELTTMRAQVPPEELFEAQAPIGGMGYAHTDGWLVRRSAFEKSGLFNESLRLHQDTELFVRFAATCRMVPGRLSRPVAMRRVHAHNRITAPRSPRRRYSDRMCMWASLSRWGRENLPAERYRLLMSTFIISATRPRTVDNRRRRARFHLVTQLPIAIWWWPPIAWRPDFWKHAVRGLKLRTLVGRFGARMCGRISEDRDLR